MEAAAQGETQEIEVPWHEPGNVNYTPRSQSPPDSAIMVETLPGFESQHAEWRSPLRVTVATGEGVSYGGAAGVVLSDGGFLVYGGLQANTLGGIHLSFLDGLLPATMDLYFTTPRIGTYLWLGTIQDYVFDEDDFSSSSAESMVGFGASFNPFGARLSWCGPSCFFADIRLLDVYLWVGDEGDSLFSVAPVTLGVGVAF